MAANPNRYVQLCWEASYYRVNVIDGIRLAVAAVASNLMPRTIFAYQQRPTNPTTGAQTGQFDHVCSPVDLQEYPEDAPILGSLPAWFRLSTVDLLFRSRAEADDALAAIKADVAALKSSLDIMDTLFPAGCVTYGTPPVSSSSSSSSSSSGP